jgi:eukaryotic translation initiation factor 2C
MPLRQYTISYDSSTGITVRDPSPLISWQNGQGRIAEVRLLSVLLFTHVLNPSSLQQLMAVGVECKQKKGAPPNLIVVILPEGGNDIYTAVKQYVYV